jgi:kynureninase
VIVDVPNAEAVSNELLRQEIIIDYRPGAGIRIAPHFYNTEEEIDHAMVTLERIVSGLGARGSELGTRGLGTRELGSSACPPEL